LFLRLDHEWRRLAASAQAEGLAGDLAQSEAALAGCASLAELVARVRWEGRRPAAASVPVLSALLRQARQPLAARALLQAVLPRIRCEDVARPAYGHGLSEHWQSPADTMSDLVAECYAAICRHAGEDHPDVARLVLQEGARRVRTARQRQRRYQLRTRPLPGAAATASLDAWARWCPAVVDLWSAQTPAERLAGLVVDAVRAGHLSLRQARLLYATGVRGLPASEAGRQAGLPARAVYYALARAEAALVRRAA